MGKTMVSCRFSLQPIQSLGAGDPLIDGFVIATGADARCEASAKASCEASGKGISSQLFLEVQGMGFPQRN